MSLHLCFTTVILKMFSTSSNLFICFIQTYNRKMMLYIQHVICEITSGKQCFKTYNPAGSFLFVDNTTLQMPLNIFHHAYSLSIFQNHTMWIARQVLTSTLSKHLHYHNEDVTWSVNSSLTAVSSSTWSNTWALSFTANTKWWQRKVVNKSRRLSLESVLTTNSQQLYTIFTCFT